MKNPERTKSVDMEPYAAVMKDIAAWDPSLRSDLNDDLKKLRSLVESRGISVIMIDLPNAGKVVDKGLSSGTLLLSKLPHTMGTIRGSLPFGGILFRCLLDKVFAFDIVLEKYRVRNVEKIDPNAVFFLRQLLYMAKKVKIQCPDKAVEDAVREFVLIEHELHEPDLTWSEDELSILNKDRTYDGKLMETKHPISTPTGTRLAKQLSFADAMWLEDDLDLPYDEWYQGIELLQLLDRVCGTLVSQFPEFNMWELVPKHGPGAVSDGKLGTFDKFEFPTWSKQLEGVFPFYGFGRHREDLQMELSLREPEMVRVAAKLIAVLKTLSGPRLITSVPTACQFLQQGLAFWFRKYLPKPFTHCVSFTDQTLSQRACLKASITGKDATVDLKSASDRVSCWTVERYFSTRPDLLQACHAVRSTEVDISRWPDIGDTIVLSKYASQGSGVTFPLQTIVYAAIAMTAVIADKRRRQEKPINAPVSLKQLSSVSRKIRVFGDDIIIPVEADLVLRWLLDKLQLVVNDDKSHTEGHFRESCGMDAFAGNDVTPVYMSSLNLKLGIPGESLRDTPKGVKLLRKVSSERLSSWVDVSNNAYQAGLWNLAEYMEKALPFIIRTRLPVWDRDLGVLTLLSYSGNRTQLSAKWNADTHVWEIKGLSPRLKTRYQQREGHHSLLAFFLSKETEMIDDDGYLSHLRPLLSSPAKWMMKSWSVLMTRRASIS